jgi:ABC-type multidrug transport system ATPase subunit
VGNPSAILADEPTGALDSENGHAVMTILAGIAKDRTRGVLVVTHDPRSLPFADRIIHIEDGRILGDERRDPAPRRWSTPSAVIQFARAAEPVHAGWRRSSASPSSASSVIARTVATKQSPA